MRFEELVLRIPGDEFKIRFHEQLTVLSGIGMLERRALTDSVLDTLSGTAESTILTYVNHEGRRVQLASAGDGRTVAAYLDDRSAAPTINGSIAPDAEGMRSLMLVQAHDVGLVATSARPDDPPELAEARSTLAALTEELQAVLSGQENGERLREELAAIDAQLRSAEDGDARRDYARVLADLERVRAEWAALQNGTSAVEGDRRLLATAGEAKELAGAWSRADGEVVELKRRFGDRARLDLTICTAALSVPAEAPADLPERLEVWAVASRDHAEVESRLRELAAARLPDPADPRVVDLATLDQGSLWGARQRVLEAGARLELEQLRLGGLDPTSAAGLPGTTPTAPAAQATDELEAAHAAVEAAQAELSRRTIPTLAGVGLIAAIALLASASSRPLALALVAAAFAVAIAGHVIPRRRMGTARRRERDALARTGAPSYLSFHIRRIEAVVDPDARRRLEIVAAEHLSALRAWQDLVRGVSIDDAGKLEAEVRAYAAALAGMGSAAEEIQALRSDLTERADPAVTAARTAAVQACEPYGVDADEVALALDAGPGELDRVVGRQVSLGTVARLQAELEQAEQEAAHLTEELDDLLARRGFGDGELEARIGALAWVVEQAVEREESRSRARPMEEIEADVVRLQDAAARMRRPEWATVTASDSDQAALAALAQRRQAVAAQLSALPGAGVDIERLADRQSAMERRVAALEARASSGQSESSIAQVADVQQYLLAHLTRAAHVGPHDESVPVLLDEPFLRIAAERKWELLDVLRRLAEKTQLIYLTDDPFVTAWARRRAAAGLILLLEPVAEPA